MGKSWVILVESGLERRRNGVSSCSGSVPVEGDAIISLFGSSGKKPGPGRDQTACLTRNGELSWRGGKIWSSLFTQSERA